MQALIKIAEASPKAIAAAYRNATAQQVIAQNRGAAKIGRAAGRLGKIKAGIDAVKGISRLSENQKKSMKRRDIPTSLRSQFSLLKEHGPFMAVPRKR